MQENFGLVFWGCTSPSFPSFHAILPRNRQVFFACQLALHEQSYSSFFSERKKNQLKHQTTSFLKGRKKKTTKQNKTKIMNFHIFDVHFLKQGIFQLGMRSYPGHTSLSLKSPEVTTTKSSFSFQMLPLLQSSYALSS